VIASPPRSAQEASDRVSDALTQLEQAFVRSGAVARTVLDELTPKEADPDGE